MRVSGVKTAIGAALMAAAVSAPAMAQDVRVLGRADVRGDGSFAVQWSGSGFEAEFSGSEFFIQADDWGTNIYRIEIDGMEATLEMQEGLHTYQLYDGEEGDHTIRVTRRTAAGAGPTYFDYIRAEGKLRPTEAPERRMLVIGDDNVTGYGVLGEDQRCSFSWSTQDHGQAFGALTAEYLDAELHTIAVDGLGAYRNYGDAEGQTMSDLIGVTIPGSQRAWLPRRYQPHVVVVSLGPADFWDGDPGEGFDQAYEGLLTKLRRDYPDALLLTTVGPQHSGKKRSGMVDSIKDAVAVRASRGDEKIDFFEMPMAKEGRVFGCDWHAGADSHLAMADVLAEQLSERLGWRPASQIDAMLLSRLTGAQ